MMPKLAGLRIEQVLAFLVVWVLLGITTSFGESITFENSGVFSLTNLAPVSFSNSSVTPTPATSNFSVVTAGYFVVSAATSLTAGLSGLSPLISLPVFGVGGGPGPLSGGNYTTSTWNPPDSGTWNPPAAGLTTTGTTTETLAAIPTIPTIPTLVPEPSTAWLVGLGLALIGIWNYAIRPH